MKCFIFVCILFEKYDFTTYSHKSTQGWKKQWAKITHDLCFVLLCLGVLKTIVKKQKIKKNKTNYNKKTKEKKKSG